MNGPVHWWKAILALLLAVATVTLFSAALPTIEHATAESEGFAPPQPHDTPFISPQKSAEQSPPRGQALLLDTRLADLVPTVVVCAAWSLPAADLTPRGAAIRVHARGPPVAV